MRHQLENLDQSGRIKRWERKRIKQLLFSNNSFMKPLTGFSRAFRATRNIKLFLRSCISDKDRRNWMRVEGYLLKVLLKSMKYKEPAATSRTLFWKVLQKRSSRISLLSNVKYFICMYLMANFYYKFYRDSVGR